tara:strand:+ start:1577 stop:1843 length:267 start_codon:yes stop_codon:yes gene_type:complete
MATKRNGKKKKNPCGDGFTVDPKYVQKDPSKPKFKCIKIKKPPPGIREEKDDNRPFDPKKRPKKDNPKKRATQDPRGGAPNPKAKPEK